MNLLEHHAKSLVAEYGLPVPQSWLVRAGNPVPAILNYPVVAKSQVPVGGRGKAGGIISVSNEQQAAAALTDLFQLSIKGHLPSAVLFEEKLTARRELYLSLRLNRDTRQIEWLASPQGGIEIEDNAASVKTLAYGTDDTVKQLCEALGTDPAILEPIIDGIDQCFLQSDLLLCEINPLIELESGQLICADAKCLVDDNARFRHPELPWPPTEGNPPKPLGGTIGCIANGAGMAMSTMDTIVAAGGSPANFLDIGGGTGEKEFVTALKQIMELGVTSIIVNIFAGISRCDEIARGIIAAQQQLPNLPPLYIRLEGTNREQAVELLTDAGIAIEPDLKTCVTKAMGARV